MESFSNGRVGERGRRLGRQFVALRRQHRQGSAAQTGVILKEERNRTLERERSSKAGTRQLEKQSKGLA